MGGLMETEKMLKHVESCAQCQAATTLADRCGEWHVMADNLMDWQCSEGPFEDGRDMCPVCDGPVDKDAFCAVCERA
jgi:hypothetical protein